MHVAAPPTHTLHTKIQDYHYTTTKKSKKQTKKAKQNKNKNGRQTHSIVPYSKASFSK